ncbi:hypothetical protein LZC94_32635 [Pendulispora albinea]|uniref:Uncharacterized protein n=1 Tax=Pendulispora albinea TaxID=2741071 RepID=A0ABZ2LRT5_9BACT
MLRLRSPRYAAFFPWLPRFAGAFFFAGAFLVADFLAAGLLDADLLAAVFLAAGFFAAFFFGTFAPSRRASERPMATACFLFVTFFPDLPERKVPSFRSCMALPTLSLAAFPYFRELDFFFAAMRIPFDVPRLFDACSSREQSPDHMTAKKSRTRAGAAEKS